jgi:hypothetical protein
MRLALDVVALLFAAGGLGALARRSARPRI